MFVRDFVEIERDYAATVRASTGAGGPSLRHHASAAESRVRQLLKDFNLGSANGASGRIEVSGWLTSASSSRAHVTWSMPHGKEGPSVDGEIELAPIGPARTQLSVSAQYKVAPSWRGDPGLLRRLAERAAHEFLEDVQTELVARLDPLSSE
jgi:hypothetical protein